MQPLDPAALPKWGTSGVRGALLTRLAEFACYAPQTRCRPFAACRPSL